MWDVLLVDFLIGNVILVEQKVSGKTGREAVRRWKDRETKLVIVPSGWSLVAPVAVT